MTRDDTTLADPEPVTVPALVTRHRVQCGRPHGVTQEIEALLRYNPTRWFFLAEIMDFMPPHRQRCAVNSALCKMSRGKGLIEAGRVLTRNRRGETRLMARYKWRV